MCGIAGFVEAHGRQADAELVRRMTETLAHRGPDGQGLWVDGAVGLGHRRLAIIDPVGGDQPMANEEDAIWITYNGELYNEPELREFLDGRHHYKTRCDTETVIHLYEEIGLEFTERLNGMFALALWDRPRRRLVLARDGLGQKPLYYACTTDGGLVFGSEVKALLVHPGVARDIDPDGLARYLFFEYLPAPYSIWRGIHKLPAGHRLVWQEGRVEVHPYRIVDSARDRIEVSLGGASNDGSQRAELFWHAFRASVNRHRRSDVPIGVFLSGGVDSSSVAAALVEIEGPSRVRSFSIGFEDRSFDESPFARAVAEHLGTDHHERIFSVHDVLDLLPEVVGWLDEPFGDASVLPTHLLSRFAREQVKVVLGGDGADELLGGYPTFAAQRVSNWFGRLPGPARNALGWMGHRLPVRHDNFSLDFKVKQFLRGAGRPMALAHQRWLGSFSGPELTRLLIEPPLDVEAEQRERAEQLVRESQLVDGSMEHALRLYQQTYLPEDILFKVDRASMACGLEVRAPFLDRSLISLMRELPVTDKLDGGRGKAILKRAAESRLPEGITNRAKKGFGIPVARWLRGPLGHLLDELLEPDRLRRQGLFRVDEVSRRVDEHRRGLRDHRKPLWTLLMFQLWADHWLGRP